MSYKWPDKDPDETIDYSVDWSRFIPDDTISAVTWFVNDASDVKEQVSNTEIVNGLQFVQPSLSGKVATARFAAGTNNIKYKITCRILTGNGLTFERSIFLRVKEK